MRPSHPSDPITYINPAAVRDTARRALQQVLPWRRVGRLARPRRLLDLLLLMAALGRSLSELCRRRDFGFSHETARKALRAHLGAADRLPEGLLEGLYALSSPRLRRRRWDVAIDLVYHPYYGDRSAPGVVGGPKKQGSKHFYAYATAVLVHRRHRYTVGLLALRPGQKPHEVLGLILGQLRGRGVKVRGVVLDSGFDSGRTILLLQRLRLAYVVPLRRKGAGTNRRNACFELPAGARTAVCWRTERGGEPVRTRAVVGRRRRRDGRVMVYAYGGWPAAGAGAAVRRAALAERAYRRRYGIETSYRQLNRGRGKTTAKSEAYRLLLVGVALLLRQAWVYLTWLVARARGLKPGAWVSELPLARLLDWLGQELRRRYPEVQRIELNLSTAKPPEGSRKP